MEDDTGQERPEEQPKRKKHFFSYLKVMAELGISRRTLQRWIDDMEIEPLEFEDQLRVFLVLPQVERLREYKRVMRTKDQDLIQRYRQAIATGNNSWLSKLRKELSE